jgi:hypothetical protein
MRDTSGESSTSALRECGATTRSETKDAVVTHYDFTLRFDVSRVGLSLDDCVELLAEHGCDDATIGVGIPGRLAFMFSREAESAEAAVMSAFSDVRSALPGALLVEAAPDLVGITEVADVVGRSRQNIRKLLLSGKASIPAPIHEGTTSIWHLAPVLDWLRAEKRYVIEDEILDIARTNMHLNVASARIDVPPRMRGFLSGIDTDMPREFDRV